MASKSQSRALTPEELQALGYTKNPPPLATDIAVQEPEVIDLDAPPASEEVMSEPVGEQYKTSPTPLPDPTQDVEQPLPTPEATPEVRDWQPEIDAARKQGDEMRVWANVARVGEDINKAFVPRQQNGQSYGKNIEEMAGLPEKRVREDMALNAARTKPTGPKPDEDPFSVGNTAFRQAIRSAFPAFAQKLGNSFERLTRPQIEKLLGVDQNQEKINENIRATDGRLKIAGDEFGLKQDNSAFKQYMDNRKQDEVERHNPVAENTALISATRTSSSQNNPETGRSPIDDRQFRLNLEKLSKATVPYAEVTAALKNLDGYLPGITDGKLPKNFPVSPGEKARALLLGGVASGTIKQQEEALVKAANDFSKIVAAYRSGLTVTEQERAYYDTMFGNKIWSDPVQLVNGLNLFKKYVYQKLSTSQQGYEKTGNPTIDKFQTLDDWENIPNSLSYRDSFWKGVGGPGSRGQNIAPTPQNVPQTAPTTPTQAPMPDEMVPVISPEGKKGKIPRSKVDAALKAGYTLQ